MTTATSTDTSLVIKRTFNAPLTQVFEAWTQPEHLMTWWHHGDEKKPCLAEVDLRPGGRYRLGMEVKENGEQYIVGGEFKEVDPPHKLVYTWEWDHQKGAVTVVSVEFRASGDQTELVLTHTGFADAELRDAHESGWTGCIDAFESLVQ
jgi:uncharacterized protein YndB with AHSA1/START domain